MKGREERGGERETQWVINSGCMFLDLLLPPSKCAFDVKELACFYLCCN